MDRRPYMSVAAVEWPFEVAVMIRPDFEVALEWDEHGQRAANMPEFVTFTEVKVPAREHREGRCSKDSVAKISDELLRVLCVREDGTND
jgi:hypothetical protein